MKTLCTKSTAVIQRATVLVFLMAIIMTMPGCLGALAQMMYVIKGHHVPAAFDGLEGKKVAVVCVSDASAYGPDTLTYTVAKTISMKLSASVPDIKIIQPSKVENWTDSNGWNEIDFNELGKGVGAEAVVAVEIGSYSIREGSTMYKGRSDLTVTVFDVETGNVAYVSGPNHFQFPNTGRPAIQTSERQFEMVYLAKLTEHVSRQFYKHDATETVAEDASLLR